MKENVLSCGFLIRDINTGLYLGCVPYGSKDGLCDLPKGQQEEGERKIETALRELKEETGITAVSNVHELGWVPYVKGKDLYIFTADADVDIEKLTCNSTFQRYGKDFPEMSNYKLGKLNIFRSNIQKAIKKLMND